jgi:hypothetical protein
MNKLLKAFCLSLVLSICVFAQNSDDEYKKNEFYVGYSNQQVSDGNRESFHGFEIAVVRNFSRYFGIKGSFSGAYRNNRFQVSATDPTTGNYSFTGENNRSLYNFLGGIQIKDNASRARFKPFAHALVGVAHNRFKSNRLICTSGTCPSFITNTPAFSFSDTGFSGAFGGGLDIKINDRIDFRAIQVDYNPVYSNSRVDNNVRFGIGFVFK